jgi:hypothetical protein
MKREIGRAVKAGGGSTLTKIARASSLAQISKILKNDLNIQVKSFEFLKVSHVERLIQHLQARGQSPRTSQNTMAHLRCALREVGREKFASDPRISNKKLGISGASRDGKHRAINLEEIEMRILKLDDGAAAATRLQMAIGLRAREAIQSSESLKSWLIELEKYDCLTISHGTKGGRTRIVRFITQESKQSALQAIKNAHQAAIKNNGVLIPSKSLQGAARAHLRSMNAAGFQGEESSHALRCTWAQAQYNRYMEMLGGDKKEALSRLSMDLGHGDGRGRYVKQVYLKNTMQ